MYSNLNNMLGLVEHDFQKDLTETEAQEAKEASEHDKLTHEMDLQRVTNDENSKHTLKEINTK